jgi:V/A-type H+-transporting ATPase subunit B
MLKEYTSVAEIAGPIMVVEGVSGAKYDELVEIELAGGEIRRGRVWKSIETGRSSSSSSPPKG